MPVFLNANAVPDQACSDTAILECGLYRVPMTDVDGLATRADSFLQDGKIKTASGGSGAPVYEPRSQNADIFNRCAMRLTRFCSFAYFTGYRPYKPAPG